jgi:selenocysteine-specific translation elongation factor
VVADERVPTVRAKLAEFQAEARRGPVRVPVDHHFDVKGVGPVVLGFVKQGEPRKHDTYQIYPSGKTCQVRSIQVHDEDVDQAQLGDHVGLALKGCTTLDLDRGFVLAPEGTMEGRAANASVRLRVQASKFFKAGVRPEGIYHLALGMQFVPLRVASGQASAGQEASVEAQLQKPLAFEKGQRGVLFGLDSSPRVVGSAVVEG